MMIEVGNATILLGDCLKRLASLPGESVQCCVTSPPYWGLRDYGCAGQIGQEPTPEEYVASIVSVFREVRRVLKADGTLWLNLGDSYASSPTGKGKDNKNSKLEGGKHTQQEGGKCPNKIVGDLKPKDLVGIPWLVAFALRADGWYLRSDIIWSKPNPMPESVTDRPTKAHEYMFLLSKSERYLYDADAIKEQGAGRMDLGKMTSPARLNQGGAWANTEKTTEGRNKRTVWEVATAPYAGAHFATFPPKLIEPCILAGSRAGDMVLDPFNGSGTTGIVALKHDRRYIGVELNPEYVELSVPRLEAEQQQMKLAL